MKPAVFFDRDGTLIESVHYLRRLEDVKLVSDAAELLRRLRELGYFNVLVTNQAVIGKGLLTVTGLEEIQAHMDQLLAQQGAALDAWYFCPETKKGEDRELVEHPDRKPGPGMLQRAAREHGLDLSRSWMVGDMISDTLAGRNAGCRGTILVRGGLSNPDDERHPSVDHVVDSLSEVAELLLQETTDFNE